MGKFNSGSKGPDGKSRYRLGGDNAVKTPVGGPTPVNLNDPPQQHSPLLSTAIAHYQFDSLTFITFTNATTTYLRAVSYILANHR